MTNIPWNPQPHRSTLSKSYFVRWRPQRFGSILKAMVRRNDAPGDTTCFGWLGVALMAVVVVAASAAGSSVAQARDDITGVWYDDTGKGAVELYACGNALCGRIVWLRQPVDRSGAPLRDANNPSADMRGRPICGLPIISELQPQPDGSWDGGRIYDPKVGRAYNVAIERESASRLVITGYLGARFLGKSFVWQRAGDLPRCEANQS